MLVLTRGHGQSLHIGDDIEIVFDKIYIRDKKIMIHFTKIQDGRVRIAVDAPPGVKILRGELERYDETQSD